MYLYLILGALRVGSGVFYSHRNLESDAISP